MTVTPITCDNCGAKYKLPESFTGSQAKCQKCGSVIDVQKQRGQSATAATPASPAARPAAARPAAAAKPAVDRSKEAPKMERPARAARGGKAAKGDEGAAEDRKGRRGEREKPAKKNNTPMLLGSVGLLAIVVVVVIFMMKKDTPKQDTTAEKPKMEKPADKPAEKPADKPVETPTDKPAETPVEKPADKPADKPAEKPAAKPTDASAAPDASSPTSDGPWEKMSNPPKSAEDLTDPKSYPEVTWPESIDAAKKASIQAWCQEVRDGGRAGIQAKQKLMEAKNEFAALFGMVEQLRLLDYRNDNDTMTGFEFNKMLEEILFEINVRFASAQIGEQISLKKAEWNNRTVKAWIAHVATYPDEETFTKARSARKAKAAAKDK